MVTEKKAPPSPRQARTYVVSGLVAAVVGALGWIVIMRPGPLEAVLDLVCPIAVLLLIFGIALAANGKEWRKAVLSRNR